MTRSAALGVTAALLGQIASGCCHSVSTGDPHKYAVLASTETATPGVDIPQDTEFWNDLVSIYCTLKDHGFSDKNIFVLYGQGRDHQGATHPSYKPCYCNGQVSKITDFPINRRIDNICNVMCCLSSGRPATITGGICECVTEGDTGSGGFTCSDEGIPHLEKDDYLVTWIKGHGSGDDCSTALTMDSMVGFALDDKHLAGLLNELRPENPLMFFETCDSAGWIDDFEANGKTIVVTSSGRGPDDDCREASYPGSYLEKHPRRSESVEVIHGRFSYWLNASLTRRDPLKSQVKSDEDLNNLVSVQESYNAASTAVTRENADLAKFYGKMHPSMSDPSETAACFFLREPTPVREKSIFGMDHDEDDATVPSRTAGGDPFSSPDLWVRTTADGGTTHQVPESGSTNTVYARIHSIGCAQPTTVSVVFYLAKLRSATFCEDPQHWLKLGEVGIPSVVGTSAEVGFSWAVEDELAHKERCLIAVLSSDGDKPVENARAVDDNNIIQRKISIR